jgi:hypothetical protein
MVTLLPVAEVTMIPAELLPLTDTLLASTATVRVVLVATMPELFNPLVVTVPVLTISTSPVAAEPKMPGLLAPLVVTLPLVMLTPPAGPSACAAPSGADDVDVGAVWMAMIPADPAPVVTTLPELTTTRPVPRASIPSLLAPLVCTEVLVTEESPLEAMASMPTLLEPTVVTEPLVTATLPELERALMPEAADPFVPTDVLFTVTLPPPWARIPVPEFKAVETVPLVTDTLPDATA